MNAVGLSSESMTLIELQNSLALSIAEITTRIAVRIIIVIKYQTHD